MTEVSKILEELNTLIGEDLKVVSFKWLARHFSIPADLAKQVLFAFVEKHRSKVNATYLLGGWTKGSGGREHVFQLVNGARLPEFRKRLDPLTSLHVYSVQPTQPKDPAELWNTDCQQTTELFDSMVRSLDQNCLVDNRWSAVECQAAKRNPDAARKVPVQPEAEVPTAAKPPPPSSIAAKVDGIMAGATAERAGVASASVAVRGSGSSSLQKPSALSAGPASVARVPNKPAAKADPPAQKGKGGAALSAMWKKAPAKKAQRKDEATAPSAAVVDGDAAIRLAQQELADSDSDDNDVPVTKRKATHSAAVFDDDEEEEEEALPKQSKPAAAPKAKGKKGSQAAAPAKKKPRPSQLEDSDEEQQQDEEEEAAAAPAPKKGKGAKDSGAQKKAPAKRAPKKQEPPAEEDEDVEMALDDDADDEVVEEAPKSRKPSFGGVKAGAETGVKRRKVTKTVINEKGEEVTETTWEDKPTASQASEEAAPPQAPKSAPAARAAAPKAVEAKPGKKSAPSKAKPSGQRGIMSFFHKK